MLLRHVGDSLAISIGNYSPISYVITSAETSVLYTHMYINVRTLIRNYLQSLEYENFSFSDLYKEFEQEYFLIKTLIEEIQPIPLKPVFYITTHKTIVKQFPNANVKTKLTKKQENYKKLEEQFVNKLLSKVKEDSIHIYDVLIKGYKTKALMLTHFPLDLISFSTFRYIVLIESNTGNIKTRSDWITKITKNSSYYHLPFNVLTLQILGDGGKNFLTMDNRYKKVLLELAEKNNWNPSTTIEKVRFDIRNMRDRYSSEILLKLSLVTTL